METVPEERNNLSFSPPDNRYPLVDTDFFHVNAENTRHVFYWVILIISVLAITANILAIRSIIERKTKFLQKACIFSLAILDMFTVILFSINLLDTLSKKMITWTLGEIMCNFIPYAQIFSTTASSLMLIVIAVDRYQNVIQTFSKNRWDPKPSTCIFVLLFLLIICAVISYPMYNVFIFQIFWVLMLPISEEPEYQIYALCYAKKTRLSYYYIALDVFIFLPIMTIFFWFYIKIAILIWKHRKPVSSKFNKFENKDSEDSFSSTKTTNTASSISVVTQKKSKKEKNLQVERKIRTFRVVLVLIISFILCRLPYWAFYTIRLVGKCSAPVCWNLHYTLVSLKLFSCVLNPLLYTFLNQTVTLIRIIRDFLWKVCCCCCSNDEFEEFGKDNPFARDQVQPACGSVQPRVHFDKDHFEGTNEKPVQKF